jgi:hypothetical protein
LNHLGIFSVADLLRRALAVRVVHAMLPAIHAESCGAGKTPRPWTVPRWRVGLPVEAAVIALVAHDDRHFLKKITTSGVIGVPTF